MSREDNVRKQLSAFITHLFTIFSKILLIVVPILPFSSGTVFLKDKLRKKNYFLPLHYLNKNLFNYYLNSTLSLFFLFKLISISLSSVFMILK